MITENLLNKTAQRLYKNINVIDEFLNSNQLTLSLEEYGELIKIRDDKKYFLVFIESAVREDKISQLKFERDLLPIINVCEKVESLLT
jgi:uncharacterized protein YlbG (UPF0298 family)